MTKQITVGYDGSKPSFDALLWAAAEAGTRGARLRIISCYEIPYAGEAVGGWAPTEAFAVLLERRKSGLAEISAVVAESTPGIEIVTEASPQVAATALIEDVGPHELVVVGASSHRGASAFWLGSTPRHVVRNSPCPVVVVRGEATPGRPDRIVVGVDGSRASDRALHWAGDEAHLHQAPLLIVHSWMYPYLAVDAASSQARDLTQVDGACVLERAVETAGERFGAEVSGELVEADPSDGLLDVVRGGDLLVLGSRGRGALTAGLFGSTVNSVLDRCVVPVVVIPACEER